MNRLPPIRPQPLIAVADVAAASGWYQRILGASSGHGGDEYERLMVDGILVLQLHSADVEHHHGAFRDPGHPPGNGVALWFEVDDFDGLVARTREAAVQIELDVHVNPNANHREIWLRDLDGYLVVFAEP
jgi:catechol 2,3-dioxygenase-like lactoylglutathione lyase family enzyme